MKAKEEASGVLDSFYSSSVNKQKIPSFFFPYTFVAASLKEPGEPAQMQCVTSNKKETEVVQKTSSQQLVRHY